MTRSDLSSAVIHILELKGVANPRDAVEVLGSPGNGVRLFLDYSGGTSQLALADELMRITGHRHPTAGEVWILDEAQSLALIDIGGNRP